MLELKTALEKLPWYSAFTFPVVPLPVGWALNSSGVGNASTADASAGSELGSEPELAVVQPDATTLLATRPRLMEEPERGERACIYDGRAQTVG